MLACRPTLPRTTRIRVEAVADNPGYSASCNRGAGLARGETLLFLNADVTVAPDCLARCVDALSDPTVGVVTPRLVRPDGTLDHACHRGLPTPLASFAYTLRIHRVVPRSRSLARYTMAWLDPATDHDVEACSGAFMLIGRSDLDSVGGWDERYRFYGEDLDLCLRMRGAGRRVRYLGTARATHVKGAFSHRLTPDRELDGARLEVKRWAQREAIASHRLFYAEHLRPCSSRPARWMARLFLALQSRRLDLAEWRWRI